MADEEDKETTEPSEDTEIWSSRSSRQARKNARLSQIIMKNERTALTKRVSLIVRKDVSERTKEETDVLVNFPELTKRLTKLADRRDAMKSRNLEIEDPDDVLNEKCESLASAIKHSKNVVIYTGAGISTAASIPDYRGPNGVWTLLQKGQQPKAQDLSDAKPTVTHMCITKLYKEGHVRHVVSQNCDGLHLRSGLARKILSEVHGNMFVEICTHCKPQKEYVRLFDVTEKTGVRRHNTERKCHMCGKYLRDTIVHFGEKGGMKSPYRWKEAAKAANNCDIILCLGTSLKILKRYPCLWCMDRRLKNRPKLYIVNLQWTPKDDAATLKINGRCDDVMEKVMNSLGFDIPLYHQEEDPIFRLYTPLKIREKHTTAKKILKVPPNVRKPKISKRLPAAKSPVEDSQVQHSSRCQSVKEDLDKIENQGDSKQKTFKAIKDFLTKPVSQQDIPNQNMSFLRHPSLVPPHAYNMVMQPPINGLDGLQALNGQLPVWSHDFLRNFHTNELSQQIASHNVETSPYNKYVNQSGHVDQFKCSYPSSTYSLQTQGNPVPMYPSNLPFQLPLSYPIPMNYAGINVPFPNIWSISPQGIFQQPHVQVAGIETVLRDHCYLNKNQMQKLSPRRDTCSSLGSPVVNPPSHPEESMSSSSNQMLGKSTCDQVKLSSRSKSCVKREKCNRDLSNTSQRRSKHLEQSAVKQSLKIDGANDPREVEDVKSESTQGNQELISEKIQSSDPSIDQTNRDHCKLDRSISQQESTSNETDTDSDVNEGELKKRKLKRSISVPGWFGKGLNVRKKKRF